MGIRTRAFQDYRIECWGYEGWWIQGLSKQVAYQFLGVAADGFEGDLEGSRRLRAESWHALIAGVKGCNMCIYIRLHTLLG